MSVLIERLQAYTQYTPSFSSASVTISNIASVCPVWLGASGTVVLSIATRMDGVSRTVSSISGTGGLSALTWAHAPSVTALNSGIYYRLDNWVSETSYWRGINGDLILNFTGAPTGASLIFGMTVYSGLKLLSVIDAPGVYTPYSRTTFPAPTRYCQTNSGPFSGNCLQFASMYIAGLSLNGTFDNPALPYHLWTQFAEKNTSDYTVALNDNIYTGILGSTDLQCRVNPDPTVISNYRAQLGTIFFLKPTDTYLGRDSLFFSTSSSTYSRALDKLTTKSSLVAKPTFDIGLFASNIFRPTTDIPNFKLAAKKTAFFSTEFKLKSHFMELDGDDFSLLSLLQFLDTDTFKLEGNLRPLFNLLLRAKISDRAIFLHAFLRLAITQSLSLRSSIQFSSIFFIKQVSYLLKKNNISLLSYIFLNIVETGFLSLRSYTASSPVNSLSFLSKLKGLEGGIFNLHASLAALARLALISKLSMNMPGVSINLQSSLRDIMTQINDMKLYANMMLKVGFVPDKDIAFALNSFIAINSSIYGITLKAVLSLPPVILRSYLASLKVSNMILSSHLTKINLLLLCYLRSINFQIDGIALRAKLIDLSTSIGLNIMPDELILNFESNYLLIKSFLLQVKQSSLKLQAIIREIERYEDSMDMYAVLQLINEHSLLLKSSLFNAVLLYSSLTSLESSDFLLKTTLIKPEIKLFDTQVQILTKPQFGR